MTTGLKANNLFVLEDGLVTRHLSDDCEWVIAGDYRAYEWVDGRLCIIDKNGLIKVASKKGLRPAGHKSAAMAALMNRRMLSGEASIYPGEWVAVGPRFNRNPYSIGYHLLYPIHYSDITESLPPVTGDIKVWVLRLQNFFRVNPFVYGILFESTDGRRRIATCEQFGFKWPDRKMMERA